MKTIKTFTIAVLAVLLLASPGFSQTQPVLTTLSAALAAGSATNTVSVTSSTGMAVGGRILISGSELATIRTVNSATRLTVTRDGGTAVGHVSGATVVYGTPGTWNPATGTSSGVFLGRMPFGSCTRTSQQYLPMFIAPSGADAGATVDCLGGRWVAGTVIDQDIEPLIAACNVPIGDVAYTSIGTSEDDVANKRMVTSLYLPRTSKITGVTVLQGTTATTDNITSGIHDSLGNPVVNTGATGVLLATASTFKNLPITANATGAAQTTTILTGPALYFVTVNANGATAEALRLLAASTYNNVLTAGTTSVTFGTFAAFTPPTTFTATVGPVLCLYR